MNKKRATFGTRMGFFLAAVGTAVGLGTLWRFPYITGSNGGGGFVFLYVFFVAIIGVPALVSELMLGKLSRRSVIEALSWKPWVGDSRAWRWFGRVATLAGMVVFSYYSVVSGWVIYFLSRTLVLPIYPSDVMPSKIIDDLLSNGWLQILLVAIHLAITFAIVARGVREGIERFARYIMPVFFVVLLSLFVHSFFLNGIDEALRFMFYPNFATLSSSAVIEALGHALFTLGLGMGAMVVYGSYLQDSVRTSKEAAWVAFLDTIIALCIGMIVFPIVFTVGVDPATGPSLLFKTLPVLFEQMTYGYWIGTTFFICLYFAAVSGSVAVFESIIAYVMEQYGFSRLKASLIMITAALGLASIPAFSGSILKEIQFGSLGILEVIDKVIVTWTIPLVTLGVVLFVSWKIPYKTKQEEFVDPKSLVSVKMFSTWLFSIRFIVPGTILSAVILQIIMWLRS